MARPQKFKIKMPTIRIIKRCIICGKIIPSDAIICSNCSKRLRRLR